MTTKEVHGDIWDYHSKGRWIVITTNGTVKNNGEAVMGRGVALQAKQRFPQLPKKVGSWMSYFGGQGNQAGIFQEEKIVSFPVKHDWWRKQTSS